MKKNTKNIFITCGMVLLGPQCSLALVTLVTFSSCVLKAKIASYNFFQMNTKTVYFQRNLFLKPIFTSMLTRRPVIIESKI